MYIRNSYNRIAYRSLTAVFLAWGILLHFSCTDGDVTSHNFSFFTVQSNLLCLASSLLLLRADIRAVRTGSPGKRPASGAAETPALIELRYASLLCILVTFLGNHAVVLLSRTFTGGVLGLPMKSFLAHYAAPALILLDWLLFTPKGWLRPSSPLLWMFAPIFYLLFTFLRVLCCSEDALARTGKYPYFFLNVDRVGRRAYLYVGICLVCFLLVGYLLFFADRVLKRKG